jgi:hypothetical protein
MFWFVTAVVILTLAIIDLSTNLHLLVTRRLRRRRERPASSTASARLEQRAEAKQVAADTDSDRRSLLCALAAVSRSHAA